MWKNLTWNKEFENSQRTGTQLLTPKIKTVSIFKCWFCNKKPFSSVMALNNHLTKAHYAGVKIDLDAKGRAYVVRTTKIKVGKVSISNYF